MFHLIKYFFTLQWMREKTADDLRRGFITEGDRLAVTHQAQADHSAALARYYRERSARLRAEMDGAITIGREITDQHKLPDMAGSTILPVDTKGVHQ